MSLSGICINCLDCVSVCPARLLPHYLYHFCQRDLGEQLDEYRIADCTACGNCTTACPTSLPLCQTLSAARDRRAAEKAALEPDSPSHGS